MGNGSPYIHTHYAITFTVNSIHVFGHLHLKSAIKCKTLKHPLPQSLVHVINDDIRRNNATYLPAQSPAHIINDKNTTLTQNIRSNSQLLIKSTLKYLKKNIKKFQCFSSNLRTKSMIKYTSYKNLRNLLRQLLSCKISHEIQLKNLKNLPPQSLACEVYRKHEN